MSHKRYRIAIVVVFVVIVLAGALYEWLVPGLSSARTVPPKLEIAIATWLLHQSVPAQAQKQANPLGSDAADIVAGRDLFRENCEVCHAYDGGGRTRVGGSEYPHAPPLRVAVRSMSDGEVFYHIRNGIRNTGMPAWDMPDRQIWQLVAYIRHLPNPARMAAAEPPESDREGPAPAATYVGSAACKKCHEEIYARWSKSRMANVVRDPREHPDAIIPDFSKPDPLVTFTKDDVAFVYGSRWKQRYFTKIGDDYFPEPAQWDVTHKVWKQYFVRNGTDWWASALSAGQFQAADRPAMRRLPFGQLRHRHQESERMERRLREMPRTGQRACRAAGGEHHPQPRPLRLRARQRHLHPMSFPGPAAEESDRGQVL